VPPESTNAKSPVGTSTKVPVVPLDSTGAKGPVGTSTEGVVALLDSASVEGLRVTPTDGTFGSLPEVGTNELVPVERDEGSRYMLAEGLSFLMMGFLL